MYSHELIQELIPFYALGGLTQAEQAQLSEHLKTCATCRQLYATERATVQMLPRSVVATQPSDETKRKLFERVDADLNTRPAAARQPVRNVVPPPPPKRAWFSRPVFAFAVVALIAVLAIGGVLLFQNRTSPDQQQIASILGNPKVQTVALAGTKDAPSASAQMFMVPGQSQAVLKVNGLQPLPTDKRYEFWFINGQNLHPSTLFTVNPDGSTTVLVSADAPVQNFNAWGVSVEPQAGVQQPTGPIVILGGG